MKCAPGAGSQAEGASAGAGALSSWPAWDAGILGAHHHGFMRQIAKFRAAANVTQAWYGMSK